MNKSIFLLAIVLIFIPLENSFADGICKCPKKHKIIIDITPPEQEVFHQGQQATFQASIDGPSHILKDVELSATFPSPEKAIEPVKLDDSHYLLEAGQIQHLGENVLTVEAWWANPKKVRMWCWFRQHVQDAIDYLNELLVSNDNSFSPSDLEQLLSEFTSLADRIDGHLQKLYTRVARHTYRIYVYPMQPSAVILNQDFIQRFPFCEDDAAVWFEASSFGPVLDAVPGEPSDFVFIPAPDVSKLSLHVRKSGSADPPVSIPGERALILEESFSMVKGRFPVSLAALEGASIRPGDSVDIKVYYLDNPVPIASQTLTFVDVVIGNAVDGSCQTLLQLAPAEVWNDPDSGYGVKIKCLSAPGKPAVTSITLTSLGPADETGFRPVFAGPFDISLNESELEPGIYLSETIFAAEIVPGEPVFFSPIVIPAVDNGIIRIEELDKQEAGQVDIKKAVTVQAIKFNWDAKKHDSNALNIRMNLEKGVNIPEWELKRVKEKKDNFPAAYSIKDTEGNTIKITVKLTGPKDKTVFIKAQGTHFLGKVKQKQVKFDNKGVSYEGTGKKKTEFVTFQLENTKLEYIRAEEIEWQWQYKEGNDWQNTNKINTMIFVVLDQAREWYGDPDPWYTNVDDKKKRKFNPWVSALEYSCKVAVKKTKPKDAVSAILRDHWNSNRRPAAIYDFGKPKPKSQSDTGTPHYSDGVGSRWFTGFAAERYIEKIANRKATGRKEKLVNCQDCASGLVTLTTVLGCKTIPVWAGQGAVAETGSAALKEFGNTKKFLPIGHKTPRSTYFSFHVFTMLDKGVYDLMLKVYNNQNQLTFVEAMKRKKEYYKYLREKEDKDLPPISTTSIGPMRIRIDKK